MRIILGQVMNTFNSTIPVKIKRYLLYRSTKSYVEKALSTSNSNQNRRSTWHPYHVFLFSEDKYLHAEGSYDYLIETSPNMNSSTHMHHLHDLLIRFIHNIFKLYKKKYITRLSYREYQLEGIKDLTLP